MPEQPPRAGTCWRRPAGGGGGLGRAGRGGRKAATPPRGRRPRGTRARPSASSCASVAWRLRGAPVAATTALELADNDEPALILDHVGDAPRSPANGMDVIADLRRIDVPD